MASRASEVWIRLGAKHIELAFHPGPEAGSVDLHSKESWCQHLRTALTMAMVSAPQSLKLSDGDRILFGGPETRLDSFSGMRFLLERKTRAWWQWSEPELAAITASLARRCAFCPISVRVDGRRQLNPAPELSPLIGASRPKRILLEAAEAFPWLSETWTLTDGAAAFALYPPTRRLSLELRTQEQSQPVVVRTALLGRKYVSSTATIQNPPGQDGRVRHPGRTGSRCLPGAGNAVERNLTGRPLSNCWWTGNCPIDPLFG